MYQMKKIILTLSFAFAIIAMNAQIIQSRLLTVDQENMEEFMEGVAEKTKMYNSKKGQANYLTFQILTGKNAQNFIRMQVSDSIQELDKVDTKGNNWWQKKVGSLHKSTGNYMWSMNKNMSYNSKNTERQNHRRVIYYNYKDSGEKDFWRFRERVKKAMVAANFGQNMNVMYCNSGCDGNMVQVRFHHKNFTGQNNDYGKPLTDMIAKYDELYGKDAYEQDSQKVDESLMPNGRMIRHQVLIPELSSPANME
jgi:hypothetical protein